MQGSGKACSLHARPYLHTMPSDVAAMRAEPSSVGAMEEIGPERRGRLGDGVKRTHTTEQLYQPSEPHMEERWPPPMHCPLEACAQASRILLGA